MKNNEGKQSLGEPTSKEGKFVMYVNVILSLVN